MARIAPLVTRALFVSVAAAALAACSETTFEGGGPTEIAITASATAAGTGQVVNFDYTAAGTYLNGVVMEWGDGTADSVATFGAVSVSGRAMHSWERPGTYTVIGKAVDGVRPTATAQVTMQVTEAAPH